MDNFFVSGLESGVVLQSLGRMRCIVEGWGFSVHEVTEAQPVVHGVGLVIDGESRCVLDPGQDLEITIGCSCAVLEAGAPWRAKVVEKVVGHFKFAIMVQVHFLAGHRDLRCSLASCSTRAVAGLVKPSVEVHFLRFALESCCDCNRFRRNSTNSG